MSPVGTTAGTVGIFGAGAVAPPAAAGSGGSITIPSGAAGSKVPGGAAGTLAAGSGAAGRAAAGGGAAGGAAAGSGVAGSSAAGSGAAGMGMAGSSVAGGIAAGSGGMVAAGAGETLSMFKRPCVKAGDEVVFIGDSYSNYAVAHRPLADFMEQLAVKDGALMSGQNYRNLAVAGTTLAAPPAAIPGQWEDAKRTKPIKVLVMSGGGNDVLINNQQCRPEGSEQRTDCKMVVQNSVDTAKMMIQDMKAAGVTDVIYFWYPHIPGGLLTGYESGASMSDYTFPMLKSQAEAASTETFHAQMIPMVKIFEGHPNYFYSDGLHANDTGEAKIAEEIWRVMKENCIGQAESSGCCMP
jgi:lysophospholipase L1-like esterase